MSATSILKLKVIQRTFHIYHLKNVYSGSQKLNVSGKSSSMALRPLTRHHLSVYSGGFG